MALLQRLISESSLPDLPMKIVDQLLSLPEGELGVRFDQWLYNGGNLNVKEHYMLWIDRSKLSRPEVFLEGLTFWCGPHHGNGLDGERETDPRSLELAEIDFRQVEFKHCVRPGEKRILGEEKLDRLHEDGDILPDCQFGQALLSEKGWATLEWLYWTRRVTWFDLPGDVLRHPDGRRCFAALSRHSGKWTPHFRPLNQGAGPECPSAVLKPRV